MILSLDCRGSLHPTTQLFVILIQSGQHTWGAHLSQSQKVKGSFFFFFFPGTEPWHFYFMNGILNFNLVFVLALFSLPLTGLMEMLLHKFNGE